MRGGFPEVDGLTVLVLGGNLGDRTGVSTGAGGTTGAAILSSHSRIRWWPFSRNLAGTQYCELVDSQRTRYCNTPTLYHLLRIVEMGSLLLRETKLVIGMAFWDTQRNYCYADI
jgi:hypothetical protein